MTKKDYLIIAQGFKEARRTVSEVYPADEYDYKGQTHFGHLAASNAIKIAEDHITALLKLENPLFDKQRFELASGRRTQDKGGQ